MEDRDRKERTALYGAAAGDYTGGLSSRQGTPVPSMQGSRLAVCIVMAIVFLICAVTVVSALTDTGEGWDAVVTEVRGTRVWVDIPDMDAAGVVLSDDGAGHVLAVGDLLRVVTDPGDPGLAHRLPAGQRSVALAVWAGIAAVAACLGGGQFLGRTRRAGQM